MTTVLVVGATGELGRRVVTRLREAGVPVRALVRRTSNSETVQRLRDAGAQLVEGDLRDRESLRAMCSGVTAIASTASAMMSKVASDSLDAVDLHGQLALVDAAENAKVTRFVYVSFADINVNFALRAAKDSVGKRLENSPNLEHVVLKPTYFMETWLPGLVAVPPGKALELAGTGESRVAWISREDVARYVVKAVTSALTARGVVAPLGGPEALSQLDVLGIFEQLGIARPPLTPTPLDALNAAKTGAPDPRTEAFLALTMGIALGLDIPPTKLPALAISPLAKVRDFAIRHAELLGAGRS